MQIAETKTPVRQLAKPPLTASRSLRWLPIGACMALAACATLNNSPPEERVKQRSTERWQAVMANDYAKVYSFAMPSYRALVSQDTFRSRQGVAVQRVSAKVFSVNCPEASKCTARVEVGVKPPLGKRFGTVITATVDESWVFEDGQWWLAERL